MSIKSLPQKMGNDLKANANAVYHALDISSGGSLSLIKESIEKSYQGFIDAKFTNLILDMADNNIETDELINFINSQSHEDREFMSNLIIKNLHADNRITIYILATLSANRIKNGSLNYYESSLLTNINALTYKDYEIYYKEILTSPNLKLNDNGDYMYIPESNVVHHVIILEKLQNYGILLKSGNLLASGSPNSYFLKSEFTNTFNSYLKKYFDLEVT